MKRLVLQKYFKILTPQAIITFSLLIIAWFITAWFFSGKFTIDRIVEVVNREYSYANAMAENIAANINQRLVHVRSIPFFMASDQSVVSMLMQFGTDDAKSTMQMDEKRNLWLSDPELGLMTQRLNRIRSEINLHTIFILNAAGDCVAAGKMPELPVFIGVNYSDRKYFLEAQKGNNSRQFAVGRTDNMNSLFYSTPVLASGQFIGVVVSRTNLNNLTNLELGQDVFVTDENGVVILAKDSNLLMKALPGSNSLECSAEVIQALYKQNTIKKLDLHPLRFKGVDDVVLLKKNDVPHVYANATAKEELVSVHVLRDLTQILKIQNDRILWFITTSFSGILLLSLVFGIVAYVRSMSHHRRELLGLNENLALQARTDALTGCANRRSFFESLEAERQRGIRYTLPFSMLIMDIDYFKKINDTYGHPGGDQVLCHLVSLVEKIIRPTDQLGRVGGEEFGILLPQTTGLDAALTAERIRAAVETTPAVYEQAAIHFTVSIGLAQWKIAEKETLKDLINRSDIALYNAKNRGRNLVSVEE
ncbi:MAG: diguanylate cyclase [Desulfamplus sp.]|nr:diguanylate cyclase [Desulfamplus sp.]